MTETPNRFPDFLQASVEHCPRYPDTHIYMLCGPFIPCPRCKGLRAEKKRNLSGEELQEAVKAAPKQRFNPEFGKNEGVAKWS